MPDATNGTLESLAGVMMVPLVGFTVMRANVGEVFVVVGKDSEPP
ncbi:MAG TPA: hypothetical protein VFV02_10610 [Acidimicrobiales bacterium]|nr:hypothetical protein [Acidimicrobiales bacterium]